MEPAVGMGATVALWKDRTPVTIVEVNTFRSGIRKGLPCLVVVQLDDYQEIPGGSHDGPVEYEFSRNPDARKIAFIRNVNNRWVQQGRGGRGTSLIVGHREIIFDAWIQALVDMR